MGASSSQMCSFYCKVAGVTKENRQSVIQRNCHDGDAVLFKREHFNEHSNSAVSVWVRRNRVMGGIVQVGYLPEEEAEKIAPLLDAGCHYHALIKEVVGGYDGLFYGLRIEGALGPPSHGLLWLTFHAMIAMAKGVVTLAIGAGGFALGIINCSGLLVRALWKTASTPVTLAWSRVTAENKRKLRVSAVLAAPFLGAAWLLCYKFGRATDFAGTLLVAALIGAGAWGVAKTFDAGRGH
jgi:hypothetical protein